ncbi:MAG: aromatic amino acid transport family protein [Patescibacteria group bacterium]|nr:aromatic amino acid transport family protein [Patescibacteria group bacterium]
MFNKPKNYYKAMAVMVGYIIGVGMFGLPYLINKAGILTFFIFVIILGFAQHLLHLIYANLILVTKGYHRLPGYVGMYLGKDGKRLVFIAKMIGNYGALLAYIIITGIFLHQLLSPYFGGSEFLYATILFALEATVIYFGIGMIARLELFMTGLLLLAVILIAWRGWEAIDINHYNLVDWKYFLLPYGAMLFAFDGSGSLPIVSKLLKRNRKAIKSVVRAGTFLPIAVIIVFTIVIVGISSNQTTPDALTGAGRVLNNGVIIFALLFGILSMITSFLGVAESVRETLWWDYKFNKNFAWALAVFVPYMLYVLGLKDLINVISFAGAIAGGLCAIMLILVFRKMKKQKNKLVLFKYKPGNFITYLLISLFVCGMLYEIYKFAVS